MQIKPLLAALLFVASPALPADDVLDMDARIELGWELLLRIEDDAAALVRASSRVDAAQAIARLETSRDHGATDAAHQLGFAFLAGRFDVPRNLAEAQRNYEIAVAQELPAALCDYGWMLYSGQHFPKDVERGLKLIHRSAELGFQPATVFLINHLRETGRAEDAAIADKWFESLGMRDEEFVLGIDGDSETRAQDYAFGQAYIYAMYRDGVLFEYSRANADAWIDRIDPEQLAVALDIVASYLSTTSNVQGNQHLAKSLQEIAIANDDRNPTLVNNYAWLLATASSDDLRDGQEAVRLMQELFSRVEPQGFMIDTLAAAHAEAGDFDAAIATQERANAWYEAKSQDFEIGIAHLNAYNEGRAWRD
ncbi:MAG: tetratricopeptide repeat protein [Woeseiaceae bacterium]